MIGLDEEKKEESRLVEKLEWWRLEGDREGQLGGERNGMKMESDRAEKRRWNNQEGYFEQEV